MQQSVHYTIVQWLSTMTLTYVTAEQAYRTITTTVVRIPVYKRGLRVIQNTSEGEASDYGLNTARSRKILYSTAAEYAAIERPV